MRTSAIPLLLPLVLVLSAAPAAAHSPIDVRASALDLHLDNPGIDRLGPFRYRGGLVLSSRESRFGGLSALHVAKKGQVVIALSDRGDWFRFEPTYSESGRLTGIGAATTGRLAGLDGRALDPDEKDLGDAESLAVDPDGVLLVSFEHRHRIWRYPSVDGRPGVLELPPDMEEAPANGGLEALTRLADGRLLMVAEKFTDDEGLKGWLWWGGSWYEVSLPHDGEFHPTALTTLPDGDVLLLERAYAPVLGPRARLSRLPAADIRPKTTLKPTVLAKLAPPFQVDNMEGLAAFTGPDGKTLVMVVSDDNFNALQRTLLMLFELQDSP